MKKKNVEVWPERDLLFYYLCEAVQIRYRDSEITKLVNSRIIKEKRRLRRQLLDFIHRLQETCLLQDRRNMKEFDIWVEGYCVQGSSGKARILACNVKGDTFMDAVKKWYDTLSLISDAETMYGSLDIRNGSPYLYGRRLFDNYSDASKAFG